MKKLILVSLAILALIFAIGTVGAYDANTIGFGQFLIQEAIAIVVIWISLSKANEK